jgi:hypothetical protein
MRQTSAKVMPRAMRILLSGLLINGLAFLPCSAESPKKQGAAAGAQTAAPATERKASPYHPVSVTDSAKTYYQSVWGVDNLAVRQTASGNLIRFTYRVTDPARAKVLGDRAMTPYLYAPKSHAVLHVPVMEKVGPLRQAFAPELGKEYWMVFSNKGKLVDTGDRVNVIIGSFHADGLVVE